MRDTGSAVIQFRAVASRLSGGLAVKRKRRKIREVPHSFRADGEEPRVDVQPAEASLRKKYLVILHLRFMMIENQPSKYN